jgi:hypothetical protein
LAKGLSSPLAAAIVGFMFIALALYTIHSFLNAVNAVYSIALRRDVYIGCDSLKFYSASLINGTIIKATIVNDGSGSVLDVRETPSPGCWIVEDIEVGNNISYSYAEHKFLRPGEVLHIRGSLPSVLGKGFYGYIVAFTRCSRAERVLSGGV